MEPKFNPLLFLLYFSILALWGIAEAWTHQSRTETIHPFKAFVHLLAFYLSYLLIPLWFFNLYAGWMGYYSIHQTIFIFFLSGILIYARFIEPHLVRVDVHQYRLNSDRRFNKPVKVALIADLHIGLFSGHERQLKIIVKT